MATEQEIQLLAQQADGVIDSARRLSSIPNKEDLFWRFGIELIDIPDLFSFDINLMELREEIRFPGFMVEQRSISHFTIESPMHLFVVRGAIPRDAYRLLLHNDTDEATDYDPAQKLVRLELMFGRDGQWEKPKEGVPLYPDELEIAGAALVAMADFAEQVLSAA
ncbi:MAG: hypothetical protein AAB414_01675 [Patescibacteria group bacterium]